MNEAWVKALIGGSLIGGSVSLILLFLGNVTGISGIIYNTVVKPSKDNTWKIFFLLGMIFTGFIFSYLSPQFLQGHLNSPTWTLAIAGLLVGFGTRLGGGCTSGHGVCGVSRFSGRSIIATLTFIIAGILTVEMLKKMGIFL